MGVGCDTVGSCLQVATLGSLGLPPEVHGHSPREHGCGAPAKARGAVSKGQGASTTTQATEHAEQGHPTYLWCDHADDIVQGLVVGVCLSDADPVAEVGDKLHLGELVDKVARDPGRVQVALAMRLVEHFKACCCS